MTSRHVPFMLVTAIGRSKARPDIMRNISGESARFTAENDADMLRGRYLPLWIRSSSRPAIIYHAYIVIAISGLIGPMAADD